MRAALAAAPAEAMDAGRMNGIALAVNVASMNAGPWGLALLRLLLADGYVGGGPPLSTSANFEDRVAGTYCHRDAAGRAA